MALTKAECSKRWRERHPEKVAAYTQKWRAKNRDKLRAQYKRFHERHRRKRIAEMRRYYKGHAEQAKKRRTRWMKEHPAYKADWQKSHPDHCEAWRAVYRAVKSGKLKRPAKCSRCGKKCRPHAHHHRGHDVKHHLDVVWLCIPCHGLEHRLVVSGQNPLPVEQENSRSLRVHQRYDARPS
jgi:hypothetical protein